MKKIILAMAVTILIVVVTGCSKALGQQVSEQLKLGQKYLAELNYEEAIVAFQKVIELDVKNLEAYTGVAMAYENMGDNEQAKDYLENGIQAIGLDNIPQEYIDKLTEIYSFLLEDCKESGDIETEQKYQNRIFEINPNNEDASNQNEYLTGQKETQDGGTKQQDRKAQFEPYVEAIVELSKELMAGNASNIGNSPFFDGTFPDLSRFREPVIYTIDNMNYLILYPCATGFYDVYYGEMKDGIREGNGFEFYTAMQQGVGGYKILTYTGAWKHDYPNGSGEYWNWLVSSSIGDVITKDKGNFVDGYLDGNIVEEHIYSDGDSEIYDFVCHMGVPEVIEYVDGTAFHARSRNGKSKIGFGENRKIGVSWILGTKMDINN